MLDVCKAEDGNRQAEGTAGISHLCEISLWKEEKEKKVIIRFTDRIIKSSGISPGALSFCQPVYFRGQRDMRKSLLIRLALPGHVEDIAVVGNEGTVFLFGIGGSVRIAIGVSIQNDKNRTS